MTDAAPIILEPKLPADAAVIWMHGLGADGSDFAPIVSILGLPEEHSVRFVFPHAPIAPVSLNNGMQMRSWFDMKSLDLLEDVDCAGIRVACYQIYKLIEEQRALGIDNKRIILAGFSQGGLVAMHAGLSFCHSLGGIIALSTWCPLVEQFYLHRDMPIFMAHGRQDPIVDFKYGAQMRDDFTKKHYQVEWHAYDMQHEVIVEEIAEIGRFIQAVLAGKYLVEKDV